MAQSQVQPTTFRDAVGHLGPPWTQGDVGTRLKYLFAGILLDDYASMMKLALNARMPKRAAEFIPEALGPLGNDRAIVRGDQEPDAVYALRLSKAFDAWKHAGSAIGMLRQLAAYMFPFTPRLRVVSTTVDHVSSQLITTWVTLEGGADGTPSFHFSQPGNWNWDGLLNRWSRFWVIIYPGAFTVTGHTWGDGWLWGDGTIWGINGITAPQIRSLQRIIQQWKGAHAECIPSGGIILASSNAQFDPASGPGFPMPSGNWDIAANRDPNAAYLDGR